MANDEADPEKDLQKRSECTLVLHFFFKINDFRAIYNYSYEALKDLSSLSLKSSDMNVCFSMNEAIFPTNQYKNKFGKN